MTVHPSIDKGRPQRLSRTFSSYAVAPAVLAALILILSGFLMIKLDGALASAGISELTWRGEEKKKVRDYATLLGRFERLKSNRLETSILGYVEGSDKPYEIRLLSFLPFQIQEKSSTFRVLIVAGIHGHESAGVDAAARFAEDIIRRPSRYSDIQIDIIPVLNPWGWEYNRRHNADGLDINRDFATDRTIEASLFRSFVGQMDTYDLFIDLHESHKSGYFLYDYSSPPDRNVWDTYRSLIALSAKGLENNYRESLSRAQNGILSMPPLPVYLNRLAGRLSLDGYMLLRKTKKLYVVETPLQDLYMDRLRLQLRTVHALIANYRE